MEILVVASSIPTQQEPLRGIFEYDQAKALRDQGVNVKFAAIDLRSIRHQRKWGLKTCKIDGIECAIYNFPVGAVPIKLQYLIGQIIFEKVYHALYSDDVNKPDIIHAHFTEIGAMAVKLSSKKHIPLVLTEHSSAIVEANMRKGIRNCALYVYPKCVKVIAVSNALASRIYEISKVKASVIHNIVDTGVFRHEKNEKEREEYRYIAVGSLVEEKNHVLLIEAFAEQYKSDKKIRLNIVGEGPLHQMLNNKIQELGVSDAVQLLGFKSREEISQLFAISDCFVLSSQIETFGVVCIEAMAAGLPVVATKCGGPEEYVNEDVGVLVEADKLCLAQGMRDVKEHSSMYDPKKISMFATSHFSGEFIGNQIKELYREILQ